MAFVSRPGYESRRTEADTGFVTESRATKTVLDLASRRPQRVADLLKREVSRIIEGDLKDPQIGFITVTGVRVSDDLRHAKVLISVLGDEDARKSSLEALTRASGYVRRLIGQRVRLRFTPEVSFRLDDTLPPVSSEGIDGQSSQGDSRID